VFDAFGALNRAFAAAGGAATCVAAPLWSFALARRGGAGRWVGAAGGLASAPCLAALLGGGFAWTSTVSPCSCWCRRPGAWRWRR
jgi:hypothetical protein